VPRSRHATPLCTERGRAHVSACRHTDATLRAAVALWFDDNAAAVARYGPIGDWDTRDVKSMNTLFQDREDFDEDIGRWNVGRVEDMNSMFCGAKKFNQPLDKWDVSSVEDTCRMFAHAASFNQPLDKWDVSSVKIMSFMFYKATKLNQPLDKWDVSSVEDMRYMFYDAAAFNQPLERWAVADGTDKTDVFTGARSFKQPATLKRFGLVLPYPSHVRTDTRAHAVRPQRQPRKSRRTLICSARAHALLCCTARARASRRSRAHTQSSARAKCIHTRWCAPHGSADTHAGDAHTFAHARAKQWTPRTRPAGLQRTHASGAWALTALTEYPRTLA
jgi:surface protein